MDLIGNVPSWLSPYGFPLSFGLIDITATCWIANLCPADLKETKVFGPVVPSNFSRWWQLKHFLFLPRSLGRWSNLTNIFQMGWNHQLVFQFWVRVLLQYNLKPKYFRKILLMIEHFRRIFPSFWDLPSDPLPHFPQKLFARKLVVFFHKIICGSVTFGCFFVVNVGGEYTVRDPMDASWKSWKNIPIPSSCFLFKFVSPNVLNSASHLDSEKISIRQKLAKFFIHVLWVYFLTCGHICMVNVGLIITYNPRIVWMVNGEPTTSDQWATTVLFNKQTAQQQKKIQSEVTKKPSTLRMMGSQNLQKHIQTLLF